MSKKRRAIFEIYMCGDDRNRCAIPDQIPGGRYCAPSQWCPVQCLWEIQHIPMLHLPTKSKEKSGKLSQLIRIRVTTVFVPFYLINVTKCALCRSSFTEITLSTWTNISVFACLFVLFILSLAHVNRLHVCIIINH